MEPQPPAPPSTAEDLFADFVEQVEQGESVDFDHWAQNYPDQRESLQRIHARWQAITVAFTSLAEGSGDTEASPASETLKGLLGRLGGTADRWSRYAIGSELARGAMGRIMVAWDQELRRDVAIKVLRGPADDHRQQRRFVEEAQIAAQLDHPGIVPIHELGVDPDGRPFFAMRLVRGTDLGAVLQQERAGAREWTRTRVLHVLLRVCEAIAYAHHKGVVHRDLKPANIMVGRFGETYVMDWGLARVIGQPSEEPRAPSAARNRVDTVRAQIEAEDDVSPLLTRSGEIVGTPAYMAPEQANVASATIDPALDIYAIGAILYHLLARCPPYQPDNRRVSASEVLAALRQAPPEPLPFAEPAELRAICERAMARDPLQRYASIEAFADDLRAFLELRVVKAYATGRFVELRKWVARNPALTALSLGLLAVLAIAAATTSTLWLSAEGARRRADDNAARLAVELDHSQFRNARMALQSEDGQNAGETLWRHHLAGRMPRATRWALVEFAERTPVLATQALEGNQQSVFSRATNKVLATGPDGDIREFDALTLAPLRTFAHKGHQLVSLSASPSAPWLVAGDQTGGTCGIDLQSGAITHQWALHDGAVTNVLCAPTGPGFVTADDRGKVLWLPNANAEPVPIASLHDGVTALAFDPRGTQLAIGTADGRVRVCRLDGSLVAERKLASFQVMSLSFAPDKQELWAGSRTIYVLDPQNGNVLRTIDPRNGTCRALVHDRDGSVIAGGWWRIDRYRGEAPAEPIALQDCSKFDINREKDLLVTKRARAGLDLIDLGNRDILPLGKDSGAVAQATNGQRAIAFANLDVVRYDLRTGREDRRMAIKRRGWLIANHDGSDAAIVRSGKKGITVLDLEQGAVRFELDGPDETPFNESALYSPDGSELATIRGSDRLGRFDARNGALIAEYHVPDQRLLRIGFSPDGKYLAVTWRGVATLRVYELATGKHVDHQFTLRANNGLNGSIAAFALDTRNQRIAVGSWGGVLAIRDLETQQDRFLQAHTGTTWSLCFAPNDPNLLVSSTGAGGITFWDLEAAEACYQTRRLAAPIAQVQVSPDFRTLTCNTVDGPVAIDLAYRDRHIAGLMAHYLDRLQGEQVRPERDQALRQWSAEVLARPWPRWQ
ncbi:MAG: protein kinase [Planctomycetes bacterium]|nr:protein kinase [Planctomycetota bacterium]